MDKAVEFIKLYKVHLVIVLIGLALIGIGLIFQKNSKASTLEIYEDKSKDSNKDSNIVVEISGEVKNPGVYTLPLNSRINDLINISGGITDKADTEWMSKFLNRAEELKDGQKIIILNKDWQKECESANNCDRGTVYQNTSQTKSASVININNASKSDLESLPGIGPVTGQKIIDQRPYSDINELLERKILGESVFNKIKNQISVY